MERIGDRENREKMKNRLLNPWIFDPNEWERNEKTTFISAFCLLFSGAPFYTKAKSRITARRLETRKTANSMRESLRTKQLLIPTNHFNPSHFFSLSIEMQDPVDHYVHTAQLIAPEMFKRELLPAAAEVSGKEKRSPNSPGGHQLFPTTTPSSSGGRIRVVRFSSGGEQSCHSCVSPLAEVYAYMCMCCVCVFCSYCLLLPVPSAGFRAAAAFLRPLEAHNIHGEKTTHTHHTHNKSSSSFRRSVQSGG